MDAGKSLESIVRKYGDANRRGREVDANVTSRLAVALKMGKADVIDDILQSIIERHRGKTGSDRATAVSYTHLRAPET